MYQLGDESLGVKLACHANDEMQRQVVVPNMDKMDVFGLWNSKVKNKNPHVQEIDH